MLGKRKREITVAPRQIARTEKQTAAKDELVVDQSIFRRHFESLFEPLHESRTVTTSLDEDEKENEPSDEESEWGGFSEADLGPEEENATVEVVEHRTDTEVAEDAESQRLRYKTFMVRPWV